METELKARLDDQLALTEFHLRLCLVRVTTRHDIPTIDLKKEDKAVETVKVWPALNFRSHRELLSEIEKSVRQEYKKLNRDMFALTFGHQDVPPMAQRMSKKRQRLNYKQHR